jgi:hypothetical protein
MTYDPQVSSGPTQVERKPAAVTVIQVALFVIVLATPALYFLLMQRLVGLMASREHWGLNEPGDTPEKLATGEFLYAFVTVIALPIVLALLAIISVIGLHKRRRWGRAITAIWVGIMLLPFLAWAAGAVVLRLAKGVPAGTKQFFLGPIDPLTLNAVAALVAFIAALIVFILIFTRGVRRWAPNRTATESTQLSPEFNGSQGFTPQQPPGYPPHAGYVPPQQGQPSNQTQWTPGSSGPQQ